MCDKKSYQTKQEAKNKRKELSHLHRGITNIYYCSDCSGYHLTSMTKERSRNYTRFLNNNLTDKK